MLRARASVVNAAGRLQQRRSLWTTAQASSLQVVKDERGYKSDLWISESDDGWWALKENTVTDPSRSVQAILPKRLELLNGSQLKALLPDAEPATHSSYGTKKPYRSTMARELEQRAIIHEYSSKWWLTPNAARKENFELQPRARPHVILNRVPVTVLNIDELSNPAAILNVMMSGDSGRPIFGAEMANPLRAAVLEHKFALPIFFTEGFVNDTLGPAALKPGASPITTSSGDMSTFYNLEDFENRTALASTIPADYTADPENPRYLTTGTALSQAHVKSALLNAGYSESLWMSQKDLGFKATQDPAKWALKPGAVGVSVPAFVGRWYNIGQLSDDVTPMKHVGTYTR